MDKETIDKNLRIWTATEEVPLEFLKEIRGGRLAGMTDISPMWRLWKLTQMYGPYGEGWWIDNLDWRVVEAGPEVSIQVSLKVYTRDAPNGLLGVGGSRILQKESAGLHHNDEALKMAVTDAIGVACKFLGFASAIYEGRFDGSKYTPRAEGKKEEYISEEKAAEIALKFNAIGISQSLLEAKSGFPMSKWVQADVDSAIKLYKTEKKKVDAANKG